MRTYPRKPLEERFWGKVQKSETGCWLWIGHKTKLGYGIFADHEPSRWRIHFAHRISYRLTVGEIPNGLFICHHCDVPACVRPDHLFLGTQADNMADMRRKGK